LCAHGERSAAGGGLTRRHAQFLALDPASGAGLQDDMLFFVRSPLAAGAAGGKARAAARCGELRWR
jgi:hypothetical protein